MDREGPGALAGCRNEKLIASLVVWIFVVPVAVAVFLIFTFLAALVPNLYFVFTPLALAFATLRLSGGVLV